MYLDHIINKYNPKYTENCSCKPNFVTRVQKSITSICFIKKRIDNAIGYAQLYHKFRSGYKLFLIDTNINLCDYVNNKIGSKIIDFVYPSILKHITTPRRLRCPYYGQLNVENLPINGELFNNMFLPVGEYMVNLTATAKIVENKTEKEEFVWNGKFYFIIPAGKTIEDDRMGR